MKKYVFKPYSTNFSELFNLEQARITSYIKADLQIEHVGSTSIPNLGGKGIIDIAIAVDEKEMDTISKQLQSLGYEFRLVHSTSDRLFFRADLPDKEEGIRRYHIHLTYPESKAWNDLIAFRDYLRSHPEEARQYAELKQKAAAEVNEDGAKYRELKAPIFEKILKKTKEE